MKITKSQLHQIIKEEARALKDQVNDAGMREDRDSISEASLPQELGLSSGYTTADLIGALQKLDLTSVVNDRGEELVNMITNHRRDIGSGRKEGSDEEKEELWKLRNDVLRAAGKVSTRETHRGLTGPERRRAARERRRSGMGEAQVKLTKSKLKQIIKEEVKKVKYGDYDKWDSDPNLDKIEQLLGTELDLKGFKFNLSTDFPGQYHIATNGELMGLERKTGVRAQDVEAILQANGYETDPGHKRLVAIDPRYREEL